MLRLDPIKNKTQGFTLIEILVSVAVFAVVIVSGTVAILAAIDANQKSQSLNSVMTNLNTALESMARDIRVGNNYTQDNSAGCSGEDCIAFTPAVGDPKIYRFTIPTGASAGHLEVGQIGAFTQLTANEVKITDAKFRVVHSTDSGGTQDKVFLTLKGYAQSKTQTRSDFYIQTLMSKRDIETAK